MSYIVATVVFYKNINKRQHSDSYNFHTNILQYLMCSYICLEVERDAHVAHSFTQTFIQVLKEELIKMIACVTNRIFSLKKVHSWREAETSFFNSCSHVLIRFSTKEHVLLNVSV